MKTNTRTYKPVPRTHEGGVAGHQSAMQELVRAVSTCMLFENTFYEGGDSIADRIAGLCKRVAVGEIVDLIGVARNDLKLRHVPLWLAVQVARHPSASPLEIRMAVKAAIKRPDEMGELLALFTKDRKGVKKLGKLPNAVKKALGEKFTEFSEYQLAKWDRKNDIRLRDVMRLVHPRPVSAEQATVFGKLNSGTLESPDTWEVRLSSGEDKKSVWEDLLRNDKLGFMALLMNMRNMEAAKVDRGLIRNALMKGAVDSVALPFRFVSAAKHAPSFAGDLSDAMLTSLGNYPKLKGTTYLVIDSSGSMDAEISRKSDVTRLDTAGALAVLLREVCEDVRVFAYTTASYWQDTNIVQEVPNVRGLPLVQAVKTAFNSHGGTPTREALQKIKSTTPTPDRVILITDEQAADGILPAWATGLSYVVNVAPYAPGLDIDRNKWVRINGWSERLVDWIRMVEEQGNV